MAMWSISVRITTGRVVCPTRRFPICGAEVVVELTPEGPQGPPLGVGDADDPVRAEAEARGQAIRADARAQAKQLTDRAAEIAAKRISEAERVASETIEAARDRGIEIVTRAERAARDRAEAVLGEAQRRLDRILAAERDVHDRLAGAMIDIQEVVRRAGVDQSADLALTVEETIGEPVSVDDTRWADDPHDSSAGGGT